MEIYKSHNETDIGECSPTRVKVTFIVKWSVKASLFDDFFLLIYLYIYVCKRNIAMQPRNVQYTSLVLLSRVIFISQIWTSFMIIFCTICSPQISGFYIYICVLYKNKYNKLNIYETQTLCGCYVQANIRQIRKTLPIYVNEMLADVAFDMCVNCYIHCTLHICIYNINFVYKIADSYEFIYKKIVTWLASQRILNEYKSIYYIYLSINI